MSDANIKSHVTATKQHRKDLDEGLQRLRRDSVIAPTADGLKL
jgi:hypothetical protein